MKKQVLALMISAAVLATSPAFAMDDLNDTTSSRRVPRTMTPEENRIEILSKRLAEIDKCHSAECARNIALINACGSSYIQLPTIEGDIIEHNISSTSLELDDSNNKLYQIIKEENKIKSELEKAKEK